MSNIIIKNILRFIVLVMLQVLVFNNIHFFDFMTPYIYLLFILMLPFETPKWLLLLTGFFTGLTVDIFSNTIGLHAIACTFMAYIRPWTTTIISAKQEYEPGMQPGIKNLGFRWFLSYTLLLTASHHFILFYLEVFKVSNFFLTFYRASLNIVFTTLFIVLSQYIFTKTK
jgi:hypothetical protein